MKKLSIALLVSAFMFLSFGIVQSYEPKKNTAEAEQYEGVYVFADCKPVKEYQYLGSVKIGISLTGSGQYQDVRDKLIKRAKKEYKDAEAIILNLKDGGVDKADVIKFK